MIAFPGPVSALITLPVPADRDGIARVLMLERRATEVLPDIRFTIPAFNRLLVEGSASTWDPEVVSGLLSAAAREALEADPEPSSAPPVTLPACYDPDLAPDLLNLADGAELAADEVARLHAAAEYLVLATGFAPGFAYLGDVDPRIASPRLAEPRRRVPAGAIGIADRRTGVYPAEGPGGWRIVGRVPAALFRDADARVLRFKPGGSVTFRPIGRADYEAEGGHRP